MKNSLALAALMALALAGCSKKSADTPGGVTAPATPVAAVPPPAGKQWTDVVTATPEGGYLMGNPNAPVKLVEYASFTCPHCQLFAKTGVEPLKAKYISSGRVSWEFRSFTIHGQDMPLTMLMNCRGAEPFFTLSEQLYANQDAIVQKFVAAPPAELQRIAGLAPVDNFKAQAEIGGLYGFFGARGMPRAQAEACLADTKAIDQITAWQTKYQEDGVNSTPTFFINGEKQNVGEWEQLEPLLAQAVG
ncbi:thioredoxin domain-containing protein [Sphingomonas crusticola]|uniref:thioredoxin domain-containing protein n=1 Tax=Sphingomonas crusticola TaxID=1697973 RepID=UPI0013C30057|nr:thioredoxin domain-containing protein [Sphingomonas crusticola]